MDMFSLDFKQSPREVILIATPIQSPKIPRYLIFVFLLPMVGIGTAGYLYYENQKNYIKKEKKNELLAISNLKINQIVAWRKNRQADAEVLFESYQLVQQLRQWLKSRDKSLAMEEILSWMSSFRGHHDYSSIFLLDEKGNVCLYTSEAYDEVGPYAQTFVNEAIRSRKVMWVDLYREEDSHYIHLDILATLSSAEDITERKRIEGEREKLIHELREVLAHVKTLSGLVPICASCKKIRDDKGYWNQIESYIEKHSTAEFSHGICPECARKLYPQLYDEEDDGKSSPDSSEQN